jgi:putative mycofactocin binding protein MftB
MPPVNAPASGFDATAPWALHPQATLRPEPFGALAYHFGTRRLSFLKSPTLVAVVERLAHEPTAEAACRAVGVDEAERVRYEVALGALAASGIIRRRDEAGTPSPTGPVAARAGGRR